MGIFWTLFKAVFSPPRLPDTTVPDDWPPDGSLHLINFAKYTQRHIPDTFVQYEFSSNVGEDDHRIPELGMEIMKRVCGSRRALTRIYSSMEFPKREKHPPERFTVRYRRFLEHLGSSASVDAPDEKTLLLLEKGIDTAAFWAGQDISTVDGCFFDFYVLPEDIHISDAKNAAEIVAGGQYDAWFDLSGWGPCALYDPESRNSGCGGIAGNCRRYL